jgi:hypothetical protein
MFSRMDMISRWGKPYDDARLRVSFATSNWDDPWRAPFTSWGFARAVQILMLAVAGGGIRCTDLHHRAGRTGVAECLALCPSHQVRITVVGGVDDGARHPSTRAPACSSPLQIVRRLSRIRLVDQRLAFRFAVGADSQVQA